MGRMETWGNNGMGAAAPPPPPPPPTNTSPTTVEGTGPSLQAVDTGGSAQQLQQPTSSVSTRGATASTENDNIVATTAESTITGNCLPGDGMVSIPTLASRVRPLPAKGTTKDGNEDVVLEHKIMPLPCDDVPRQRQQQRPPGAYSVGSRTCQVVGRAPSLQFSLLGSPRPGILPTQGFGGSADEQQQQGTTVVNRTELDSGCGGDDESNNSNSQGVAVAVQVEQHTDERPSMLPVAMDVDIAALQQKKIEKEHRNRMFYSVIGFMMLVVIATIAAVTVVAMAKSTSSNESSSSFEIHDSSSPSMMMSPSPTPLPPMENLEQLYDSLPYKTKESLYNRVSPQYMAWEWLLNHPNISKLQEWRKRQVFAIATFYYSFQGPNWPETTPSRDRWMDVTTSECSWVLSDAEVAWFTQESIYTVGPAYDDQDYHPCNEDGELQTILLHQLFLPAGVTPTIPPEIALLPSLKILGIVFSRVNAKLSDLLVPELIQLPSLSALNFHGSGASGTIPKDFGLMTGLRHLLIGDGELMGTIPPEISNMSSLEYFSLSDAEGVGGRMPTQIGLMSRLTGLVIFRSSISGEIPAELGLLTNMREVGFSANLLSGPFPSELGLMTMMKEMWARNNLLSGSLPSEIGLMTNMIDFRLGNDLTLQDSYNNFSGSLPQELWRISHLRQLYIPNLPNLHGRIPKEILMPNLTLLSLSGSPHLSGTIPEDVCSIQELDFDCSELLCGCDCQCVNETNH